MYVYIYDLPNTLPHSHTPSITFIYTLPHLSTSAPVNPTTFPPCHKAPCQPYHLPSLSQSKSCIPCTITLIHRPYTPLLPYTVTSPDFPLILAPCVLPIPSQNTMYSTSVHYTFLPFFLSFSLSFPSSFPIYLFIYFIPSFLD